MLLYKKLLLMTFGTTLVDVPCIQEAGAVQSAVCGTNYRVDLYVWPQHREGCCAMASDERYSR